jgi:hypothetical protein
LLLVGGRYRPSSEVDLGHVEAVEQEYKHRRGELQTRLKEG